MNTNDIKLPALPQPDYQAYTKGMLMEDAWSAELVREAQRAAVLADRAEHAAPDARQRALEEAAQWVQKRADAYDAEHGKTDPETGTREWPGDGEEYMFELQEIADGIRAIPSSGAEGSI